MTATDMEVRELAKSILDLIQPEKAQEQTPPVTEQKSPAEIYLGLLASAKGGGKGRGPCWICGGPHMQRECPQRGKSKGKGKNGGKGKKGKGKGKNGK